MNKKYSPFAVPAKLALAAAVAATVSAGANAVAVDSNITGMQMTLGTTDLLAAPGYVTSIAIGGDTVTGLTMTGDMTAFTAGTYVYIDMQLTDGIRQGVNGAGGTIFTSGYIYISTSTDGGVTINPFDTVDASVTNLPFLAGDNGHIAPAPTQTTAGLVIDDAGYGTLPGLWDLVFFGSGFNNAAGKLALFGNASGIFLEGEVFAASAVPVPAAAWLFGSALLGLAGVGRKRKAA